MIRVSTLEDAVGLIHDLSNAGFCHDYLGHVSKDGFRFEAFFLPLRIIELDRTYYGAIRHVGKYGWVEVKFFNSSVDLDDSWHEAWRFYTASIGSVN